MSKRSLNVGVVGMGNMGVPIARNLAFKARSSFYLQLHSRSFAKVQKVSEAISTDGATCAMRLHHRYSTMTKWCDVILLALANREAAAHALLEHEEALIRCARPGQIIVDHTTVDVGLSRACAMEAQRRGAIFLDAPMSGSPRSVFNNQLVLMVGGDPEYYQRVLPIFRLYADHMHHMGESGSGTATKLVSQALVASHNAAAAEAMTMANRLGIEDHRRLVQVLDASWGSSTMLRRNAGAMQDAIRSPDAVPPTSTASVTSVLKDLELLDESLPPPPEEVLRRARSPHMVQDAEGKERFPVLDASLRMLGAAQETGYGSRDLSTVVHFIHAAAEMERQERIAPLARQAETEDNSPRHHDTSSSSSSSSSSTAYPSALLDEESEPLDATGPLTSHNDNENSSYRDAEGDESVDPAFFHFGGLTDGAFVSPSRTAEGAASLPTGAAAGVPSREGGRERSSSRAGGNQPETEETEDFY